MIKLATVLDLHAQLERQGVKYGLGAKAVPINIEPEKLRKIDCSGYVRYLLHKAGLSIPDGSQNQRAFCEQTVGKPGSLVVKKLVRYADVNYALHDDSRLFIAFIKPFTNGCGKVGHVWLVIGGETIESHGGVGVNSRPWDTGVLRRQVFSCYELAVE